MPEENALTGIGDIAGINCPGQQFLKLCSVAHCVWQYADNYFYIPPPSVVCEGSIPSLSYR